MVSSHGCDKVQLNEAGRQNTVYMLVMNESAVCDVYLCDTSKRSALALEGFTCFCFFHGKVVSYAFPSPLGDVMNRFELREPRCSALNYAQCLAVPIKNIYIRIYTVLYYEVLASQRTFFKLFSSLKV